MEDTVTVYSTDDVEKNKLLRGKVKLFGDEGFEHRDFKDLVYALGYDRAVELTRDHG